MELSSRYLGASAGRVFIDLDGTRDRMLDLSARKARGAVVMGETLAARRGETVTFTATTIGADLAGTELVHDGVRQTLSLEWPSVFSIRMGERPSWVRINLRDAGGRLLLIGNPIYLTPAR